MPQRQGSYSLFDYEPNTLPTEEELEIERQMDGGAPEFLKTPVVETIGGVGKGVAEIGQKAWDKWGYPIFGNIPSTRLPISDEERLIAQQMGDEPSAQMIPPFTVQDIKQPSLMGVQTADTTATSLGDTGQQLQTVPTVEELMEASKEPPTGDLTYDEFTESIRSAMQEGRLEDALLAIQARNEVFPEGVMADVQQQQEQELALKVTLLKEQGKIESAQIFQQAANRLQELGMQGELTLDRIKTEAEVMMAQITAKGEMDAKTAAQVHIYKLETMERQGLLDKDKLLLEYDETRKNMAARGLLDAESQASLYEHEMSMLEKRGELDAETVIKAHANAMALQGSVNANNLELAKINAQAQLEQIQLQGDLNADSAANLQESIMAQLKWIADSDMAIAKEQTLRDLSVAETEGRLDIELAAQEIAGRLEEQLRKHAHEIELSKQNHDNIIKQQEAQGELNAEAANKAFYRAMYKMNKEFELLKQLEEIRRRAGTSPFRAASSFFRPLAQRVEV